MAQVDGFIAVTVSAIMFGSFSVFLKTDRVKRANVDTMVYQIYFSFVVLLSGFCVLFTNDWVFTPFGIASAALWVPSSLLSIVAIRFIGISVAQGTWSGTTILVSFFWGSLYFHDDVKDVWGAVFALVTLLVGVLGISWSSKQPDDTDEAGEEPTLVRSASTQSTGTDDGTIPEPVHRVSKIDRAKGLACATLLGVTNGSMLVPLRLAPRDAQGLKFVPSFGIGVIIVTVCIACVYFPIRFLQLKRSRAMHALIVLPSGTDLEGDLPDSLMSHSPRAYGTCTGGEVDGDGEPLLASVTTSQEPVTLFPPWELAAVFPPAFLSGAFWNIGNMASIVATEKLGLTVGFPLTQCALLVGGLWGVFYFREIVDPHKIGAFFCSAVILLAGAALLGLYG